MIRIPWRLLPWGKLAGAVLGVPAGLFGILFGLIVGHLVDQLARPHILRRLIRTFLADACAPRELGRWTIPIGVLAVLTDEALCSGGPRSAVSPVRRYLAERFARGPKDLQLLDIAAEAALSHARAAAGVSGAAGAGSDQASDSRRAPRDAPEGEPEGSSERAPGEPPDPVDEFLRTLRAGLSRAERAEVAWLAGRIARDAGSCAQRRAEEIGRRLEVDERIVADAARREGTLDERSCMLLGVPQDADREQVKRAYRRLAAQFHPDGTGVLEAHQQRQAGEAFIRIRAAYERLMRELGEEP